MILKKIISTLIIFSFLIPQQTYEFTEEQVQTLYSQIQTLEHADSTNQKMIENLNSQIYMYIQTLENDSIMIVNYKRQLELKDSMIEEIKPKWYENRYLWFGFGVIVTAGSVHLAGQVN